MHRLLARQLSRALGEKQAQLLLEPCWQAFSKLVDDAYQAADADRELTERSMDLASAELTQRNEELTRNNKKLEHAEQQLRRSHDELECRVAERTAELRAAIDEVEAARNELTQVNAQLEQRVIERTEELRTTHNKLVEIARQSGMTEVATDVLHNVGNVLNSVNVSAALVDEKLRNSAVNRLARAMDVVREHQEDLAEFIQNDQRGRNLPNYLIQVADHLVAEQAEVLSEVTALSQNIEHIKQIVVMQQTLASGGGMTQAIDLANVTDEALRILHEGMVRHGVLVKRQFADLGPVVLDKHRLLQILINLLSNAKNALKDQPGERIVFVRIGRAPSDPIRAQIEVIDNGEGIPPENLTRIFNHGFTTRTDGHGFGLHSAANTVAEMGGAIRCHSDGAGRGATFVVELPIRAEEVAA